MGVCAHAVAAITLLCEQGVDQVGLKHPLRRSRLALILPHVRNVGRKSAVFEHLAELFSLALVLQLVAGHRDFFSFSIRLFRAPLHGVGL